MIDLLLIAGQWLGMLALLFGACLVIMCAAEENRDARSRLGAHTAHDWDAFDRRCRQATMRTENR